jgi:murein DD-endopeptidase MepM/ murein hydrolase activator NlpD
MNARKVVVVVALIATLVTSACQTVASTKRPTGDAPRDNEVPGSFYVVKRGDTLMHLAQQTGISVRELIEVNGLTADGALSAGQVLFVPARPGARPAPAFGVTTTKPATAPSPTASTPGAPPAITRAGSSPVITPTGTDPPVTPAVIDAPPAAPRPLAWPLDGVVIRDFSAGGRLPYDGLLIAAPLGTPVHAAADGEVLFAGEQGTSYGVFVVVQHDAGLVTVYANLGKTSVHAKDKVHTGDVLGVVGMSGGLEAPRLHFQARQGRTPTDPLTLLPP